MRRGRRVSGGVVFRKMRVHPAMLMKINNRARKLCMLLHCGKGFWDLYFRVPRHRSGPLRRACNRPRGEPPRPLLNQEGSLVANRCARLQRAAPAAAGSPPQMRRGRRVSGGVVFRKMRVHPAMLMKTNDRAWKIVYVLRGTVALTSAMFPDASHRERDSRSKAKLVPGTRNPSATALFFHDISENKGGYGFYKVFG